MKQKFLVALAAFLTIIGQSYAQDGSFIQYRVIKGDTVSKIAREYGVSVSDIIGYNPDAANGLSIGAMIMVPTKALLTKDKKATSSPLKDKATTAQSKTYTIKSKDTLYGIGKQLNISVDSLRKWNPNLNVSDLKVGTIINVVAPAKTEVKKDSVVKEGAEKTKELKTLTASFTVIQVEAQQTLYGIATKYNTTVQRLKELNPEVTTELRIGQEIKVPSTGANTTVTTQQATVGKVIVKPKETLYSLSKEYNVSVDDLIKANPIVLESGVVVGMELVIPSGKVADVVKPKETVNTTPSISFSDNSSVGYTDLTTTLNKSKSGELALILPFNVSRLGDDMDAKVKKDPFLNMTLDFYSGALLAIEKANKLGLNLTVNVYDSDESKSSSSVANLFKTKDFSKTDVIIGPFFQQNVDQAVKALPNSNTILVSPLSNEKANPSNQLVQTMPYVDVLRRTFIDYFLKKEAKITVIVDDKKVATKKFMQNYFPNVKVISTSVISDLSKTLSSNKNNVFILDSNSITSALSLVNTLKGKTNDFDIQIASFDKSEIFDYDEIKVQSLVDLKYTFPSVIRETGSASESLFAQEFKAKNNISPNRFATRGYDVTLDVILRMFQDGDFVNTLSIKTQEIENKFIYGRNPEGTIRNSGIYILQYSDDLTVKVLE